MTKPPLLFSGGFVVPGVHMRKASIVVIKNKDGKLLAVSRGNDLHNWGFAGGKLELGESFEDAAKREVYEETGLRIYDLKKIDEPIVYKDTLVAAFMADKYYGKLKPSKEGEPKWVEPQQLLESEFQDYNESLLKKLNFI